MCSGVAFFVIGVVIMPLIKVKHGICNLLLSKHHKETRQTYKNGMSTFPLWRIWSAGIHLLTQILTLTLWRDRVEWCNCNQLPGAPMKKGGCNPINISHSCLFFNELLFLSFFGFSITIWVSYSIPESDDRGIDRNLHQFGCWIPTQIAVELLAWMRLSGMAVAGVSV